MSPEEMLLRRLPAKTVQKVLSDLKTVQRQADDDDSVVVPLVTLHLRSGRDLSGRIVQFGDSQNSDALLVQREEPNAGRPGLEALYIESGSIEAITVHEPSAAAYELSSGILPKPASRTPPPSSFDVKRRATDLGASLSSAVGGTISCDVAWEGIGQQGESLRSLELLLKHLGRIIPELAKDPMARESFQGSVKRIQVAQAEAPGVRLAEGALKIEASFGKGSEGRFSRDELRRRIEKAL